MNIAIVGVGRWGVNHARVLIELTRSESRGDSSINIENIVAIDPSYERLKKVRSLGITRTYTSVDDALSSEKIDAAIIAVPTKYHYIVAKKLIPITNTFIEKPLAASLQEAKELVKLAKKSKMVVSVGHIERYNPIVIAVKNKLKEISEDIVHIFGLRIGPGPPTGSSGNLGVAHDLLVHDVDIANMFSQNLPSWVLATTIYSHNYPYETEVNAIYGYKNDITASLRASWRTGPKLKKRLMSLQTDSYIITFDYISQSLSVERGLIEHRSPAEYVDVIASYESRGMENISLLSKKTEPLLLEITDFLESVNKGREPIANLRNGYIALKCVLASLKAANRGLKVNIDWENDPI